MTRGSVEVNDLSVRFGGVAAVNRVTFSVEPGELVGIIGPNGAGKSTLFDAICGFVAHEGRVLLDGRDLTRMAARRRAQAGVGRSFQDARLFPSLTVREALVLAHQRTVDDPGTYAHLVGWPGTGRAERRLGELADHSIELFGLGAYADKFISELSTGTRRIAELATLQAQQPSVILLDEPSSGIAQREVEALADVVLRLRDLAGATMLVVEHDIPMVRRLCRRLVVLEYGQLIADGEADDVLGRPEVIAGYLGTTQVAVQRSGRMKSRTLVEVVDSADAPAPGPVGGAVAGLPATDEFHVPWRGILDTAEALAFLVLLSLVLR